MTLDALAESTKINRSLLADLERNDLSRWPSGIYGRAFIREYAKALRLSPNEILEEFRLLESTESRVLSSQPGLGLDTVTEFRLVLADSPSPTAGLWHARLLDAACALALVLAAGYATTLVTGLAYWTASGMVALIWCPLVMILGGGSMRRVVMSARRHRDTLWRAARALPVRRGLLRRRRRVSNSTDQLTPGSLTVDTDVDRLPAGSPYIH